MTRYEKVLADLRAAPKRWLVTGAAGFIGSSLVEALLSANQTVVGLDNFSTGKQENADACSRVDGAATPSQFRLVRGDIRSLEACRQACDEVDYILHQAAQVSVPASIVNPLETHEANATGVLNVLLAARDAKVQRVVYASSCSIYGDSSRLPLSEDQPSRPLSPYAASKQAGELYAESICRTSALEAVGLRYFNVFGPRQDPKGVYAAVIPLWIAAMMENLPIHIFGDGSTTRDFCYVANVIQANLLAATAPLAHNPHEVVNVAVNDRTSLNELFELLRAMLLKDYPHLRNYRPIYEEFRPGDIRHSQADITKAQRFLGYAPSHSVGQGLQETLAWYRKQPPSERRHFSET